MLPDTGSHESLRFLCAFKWQWHPFTIILTSFPSGVVNSVKSKLCTVGKSLL